MSRRKHKPKSPEQIAIDKARARAEAKAQDARGEYGIDLTTHALPQNADVISITDKAGKVQTARRICGLDWLMRKDRVDPRQYQAGCRYADDYHTANDVSVRSCLNDNVRGGDVSRIQEIKRQASERLQDACSALNHQEMIALCNLVLGEGLTIRSLTKENDLESARAEAKLCIALDILADHYGAA
jgi:hypothetical protein